MQCAVYICQPRVSSPQLPAWPHSACNACKFPVMQGLSFPATAWMACHRTLIMGTMIARFIPYKLAPSVFPRETLPPADSCVLSPGT